MNNVLQKRYLVSFFDCDKYLCLGDKLEDKFGFVGYVHWCKKKGGLALFSYVDNKKHCHCYSCSGEYDFCDIKCKEHSVKIKHKSKNSTK